VPAGQIREIARLYATTKAATIDLGNRVEHTPSSNDAIRAVAILMAITGHLDRQGGNLLGGGPSGGGCGMPRPKTVNLTERYTQEMVDKLVGPEFPKAFQPFLEGTSSAYYRIFDSVLTEMPYPVRTVIAPGTQPTVSTRGSKLNADKQVICQNRNKQVGFGSAGNLMVDCSQVVGQDQSAFGRRRHAVLGRSGLGRA
jgi:anaerobic selenocysteine-containing dehydrogenase